MTTVFYSWQSELANNTNRGFIGTALEKATKAIRDDATVEHAPRLDSDTQGVPGAPDIGATIFEKVASASVFVADVSLVQRGVDYEGKETRRCPNPNVLVELGYAIGKLGWSRVVMVVNEHYGEVKELPFDLQKKKCLTYRAAPEEEMKAPERNALGRTLEAAVRLILDNHRASSEPAVPSAAELAIAAIDSQIPARGPRVREYMRHLHARLAELRVPSRPDSDEKDEAFRAAVDATVALVDEFGKVAAQIADLRDQEALLALCRGFEAIQSECDRNPKVAGLAWDSDYDFFRFVGHELFVMLIAALIAEERWDLVKLVVAYEYHLETNEGSRLVSHRRLSYPVLGLHYRNERLKLGRVSLHADILKERHETAPLSARCSHDAFMNAEFFLALHSHLSPDAEPRSLGSGPWRSPSLIYMRHRVPEFLTRASKAPYAKALADALGLQGVDDLKLRLGEGIARVSKWVPGDWGMDFGRFDASQIGSRP
jgi:hypothetical protein